VQTGRATEPRAVPGEDILVAPGFIRMVREQVTEVMEVWALGLHRRVQVMVRLYSPLISGAGAVLPPGAVAVECSSLLSMAHLLLMVYSVLMELMVPTTLIETLVAVDRGGSIYLITDTLSGSGEISVEGGIGKLFSSSRAGGGGGGRIAVYYEEYMYTGTILTIGGYGFDNNANASYGGAGTVYLKSSASTYGDLIVANGDNPGVWSPLEEPTYDFASIEIADEGHLKVLSGTVVTLHQDNLLLHNDGSLAVYGEVTSGGTGGFNSILISTGASLSVGNGGLIDGDTLSVTDGSVSQSGSGDLDLEFIDIGTGGTYVLNRAEVFPDIRVRSGGEITHGTGATGFDLTVTGDLTVEPGGRISADGKGYGAESGPGRGYSDGGYYTYGSGAGYGGIGGHGSGPGAAPGAIYCPSDYPTSFGSGGGTSNGGRGGGQFRISVYGTFIVDGIVCANGAPDVSGSGSVFGGGGSGGTVYISTNSIEGSGSITSLGGDGLNVWGQLRTGGGGGGRVIILYESYQFSGNITTDGGHGFEDGQTGSVYKYSSRSSLQLNRQIISNHNCPCQIIKWDFSVFANQQVRLEDVAMSEPDMVFDLPYSSPESSRINHPTDRRRRQVEISTSQMYQWVRNPPGKWQLA